MKVCEGPGCSNQFAARGRKRFCCTTCRVNAYHQPAQAGPKPARPARSRGKITALTRKELGAKADTAAGQVALMLAGRLDHSAGDTLAAVASATERWAAAMERALREGPASDPVAQRQDEVAKRRAERASK